MVRPLALAVTFEGILPLSVLLAEYGIGKAGEAFEDPSALFTLC
jgi:hypothetical protein